MKEAPQQPSIECVLPILTVGAELLVLAGISTLAVSKKVRQEILNRDGHQCTDDSGEEHLGGLQVSHTNHTKDEHYEDPANLTTRCERHHLVQHLESEGENGLSANHNHFGIRMLASKVADAFKKAHEGEEE
jgi:hypothetical protein